MFAPYPNMMGFQPMPPMQNMQFVNPMQGQINPMLVPRNPNFGVNQPGFNNLPNNQNKQNHPFNF